MLKLGALLFAAAVAASTPIHSVPSQPPAIGGGGQHKTPVADPKQHTESPQRDERGTNAFPLVIKILPSDAAQDASKTNSHKKHEQTPDWWMIVPTWLLAIFTGGLFFFTFKLWGSTSVLIGEERSASQRDLRAYVFSDSSQIAVFAVGQPIRFAFKIKNFGRTPAQDIMVGALISFNNLSPDDPVEHRPMMLAPTGVADAQFVTVPILAQVEFDAIVQGTSAVFIKVDISYRDDSRKTRHTYIRQFWRGIGIAPTMPIPLANADGNDWN